MKALRRMLAVILQFVAICVLIYSVDFAAKEINMDTASIGALISVLTHLIVEPRG